METKWRWEKINLTGGQGGHAVARPRSCSRSPRCAGASHGAVARPARHLSVSREAAGGAASGAVVCGSCACRTGGSGHDLRRSTAATSPPYPLVLATQQRVDTHYRKHMGEKPHKCTWPGCSYATARQHVVDRHRLKHTGERPYKCTWAGCSYAGTTQQNLDRHIARRHGTNS